MKTKKILLIMVALIIVGVGVFYAMNNNTQKNNNYYGEDAISSSPDEIHPFGFTSLSKEEGDVAKEVGATITRASIGWDQIEPSKNKFNFDKFKGQNNESGFTPFIRLRMQQSWATKCNESGRKLADCPPKDLGDWTDKAYSPTLYDFIYKTLEFAQSKGYKNYKIIVGNEVNSKKFWLGTSEDYVKTRTTIYKAASDVNKKYNSQFQIIDNGFASAVWEYAIAREAYCSGKKDYAKDFAERTFRRETSIAKIDEEIDKTDCSKQYESEKLLNNAFKIDPNLNAPSFDFMSYHFYEPWDVQGEVIDWIKGKMKKNGYDRPILNTEGGFVDKNRMKYEDFPELKNEVADEIVKIHTIALVRGVQSWLWLPLIEEDQETTGWHLKGLETGDRTKLPAYYSYKTMTSKIDGFKSVETLSGLETKYAYKFTFKDKNPAYVIWDTKDNVIDFSSILSGEVKVTKVDGTTQNISSSNINISESPIYIETL